MKRGILLIISLYLFSISGMAAQFHYCGGNLETISIGYESISKCCCATPTKSKSCCKSEQIKPSVSHHFAVKHQVVQPITFIAIQVLLYPELLLSEPVNKSEMFIHLSYLDQNVPVFIKNCTYRI